MSGSNDDLDVWTVADGRFRIRLNGSGSISLECDFGSSEIDLDDIVADDLASALAQAAKRRRTAA